MSSSGTDEYISRIVEQYSKTLFRTAYTVLHSADDAEDIVQEVFIRLLRKSPGFNDAGHEKAWLLRVTINLARNRLKSATRSELSFDEFHQSSQQQTDIDLLDAVLALPEKYSTVIHLYYYEGYSIAEIARILHTPAATVGTRLYRGRSLLRDQLEGDDSNE